MMNSAYFTPRSQIIEWINDLLITHLTKIQQLGSGSIYCQILDAAYPDKVQLCKVKWHAYLEVDFLFNFKILQTAFERIGIKKNFDAQRLAKAKYQDNLEFIQWMMWQCSAKINENGLYNAPLRRNNAKINFLFTDQKHFDLSQTVTRDLHNKENTLHKQIKNVKMTSSVCFPPEESTLKPCKSILGLKSMNCNSQELSKPMKKSNFFKKPNPDKENINPSGFSKAVESKLRKKKVQATMKPKAGKEIVVEAVEMVQSDEQQCF